MDGIAKELVYLGKLYRNVLVVMAIEREKIFIVTEKEKIVYHMRKLAYSEEGQDSWLTADGLCLRVDQSVMRRLLSRDSDSNHETPRRKHAKAVQLEKARDVPTEDEVEEKNAEPSEAEVEENEAEPTEAEVEAVTTKAEVEETKEEEAADACDGTIPAKL